MNRKIVDGGPKKKRARSYANGGYLSGSGGRPCPTCYAPMEFGQGNTKASWACTKHGEPTRP